MICSEINYIFLHSFQVLGNNLPGAWTYQITYKLSKLPYQLFTISEETLCSHHISMEKETLCFAEISSVATINKR